MVFMKQRSTFVIIKIDYISYYELIMKAGVLFLQVQIRD